MHQSCPEVQESTRHWLMEIHGRTSFCAYQHALWLHLQYTYVCRYASIRELFHVLYPVPSCSISMEQCSKTCLSGASIGFRKLIIAWWVCPKIWCISKWPIQLWKIRGNDWLQLEACQLKYAEVHLLENISLNSPGFVKKYQYIIHINNRYQSRLNRFHLTRCTLW